MSRAAAATTGVVVVKNVLAERQPRAGKESSSETTVFLESTHCVTIMINITMVIVSMMIGARIAPQRANQIPKSTDSSQVHVKSANWGLPRLSLILVSFFSRLVGSLIFIRANYCAEKLCLNIELRVITLGYTLNVVRDGNKAIKRREG